MSFLARFSGEKRDKKRVVAWKSSKPEKRRYRVYSEGNKTAIFYACKGGGGKNGPLPRMEKRKKKDASIVARKKVNRPGRERGGVG